MIDRPQCGKCHDEMTPQNSKRCPELFLCDRCVSPFSSEPEYHSKQWLVQQTVAAFRRRASTWESEQGELGKIVAFELRVVVDCFEEILSRDAIALGESDELRKPSKDDDDYDEDCDKFNRTGRSPTHGAA